MTATTIGTLHMGTSSWTFSDWRGLFYPPGIPTSQQLNFYATKFNSVEVNTSFYALPAPKTLLQWVESVPAAFTFSLKAPREITHDKRLLDVEQASRAYLDVLRSLGHAVAPGLVQFPPSVSRSRNGHRLAGFIDRLAALAEGVPLSVEVRATDLMTNAFAQFLAERHISFVVVERSTQPDTYGCWLAAVESEARLPLHIRLIGHDRDPLPDNKMIRRPQDKLLDKWAQRIADVLHAGRDVFCYVHNPFEGHSPETVRRLHAKIREHLPLPAWEPAIVRPAEEEDGGQLTLF